eukprot:jgi/Botrbrau1/18307/Bobra.0179s0036.1
MGSLILSSACSGFPIVVNRTSQGSRRSSLLQPAPESCSRSARAKSLLLQAFQGSNTQSCHSRREILQQSVGIASSLLFAREWAIGGRPAGAVPEPDDKLLCEADCLAKLDDVETVTLPSGLKFKEIRVGKGPSPPVGYQVVVNYVAMTPNGRVFDSSLNRGFPYDIRVGAGQIVPGLDEGLKTMKVGGLRRLYIPGNLSFPKGLPSAAGRPRVPPASPVIFDVELLIIPGLDSDEA